jgi:ribosome-binding protein aMBF1 (putative translation factor)
MTAIVCDICGKQVPGARREVNYFTILDKDICESCHDELRDTTKQQMRARQPYSFKEYYEFLSKNLAKATGR